MISILKRSIREWINAAEGQDYVKRFRLTQSFRQNIKVSISHDGKLFWIEDGAEKLAVARKSRLKYHLRGLSVRRRILQGEYLIDADLLRPGDTVIDCGANVGEFSLICASRKARVIAFEPDRVEFTALLANAQGRDITPIQKALWKAHGEMQFYDRTAPGDSSLLSSGKADNEYIVETIRLDDVAELPKTSIRLIKLEAEGAEPEILEGMTKTLARTEFITVDMGPERGVSNQCTIVECTKALHDAGFQMRSFYHPRLTALFEKVH